MRIAAALFLCAPLMAWTTDPQQKRPPPRRPTRTAPVRNARGAVPDYDAVTRQVWTVLQQNFDARPVLEDVVHRIVDIGPQAVPAVLDILCGRSDPPTDGGYAAQYKRAQPSNSTMVAYREQVLYSVFGAMDPDAVLEPIAFAATENIEKGSELVALRALSRVRDLRALDQWLRIANGAKASLFAAERERTLASEALATMLHGTPGAYRRLERALPPLRPHTCTLVALAVESTADLQSLDILIRLLGRCDQSDAEVVRGLAKLARAGKLACDEDDLARLRSFLHIPGDRQRSDAAIALGGLCDVEAGPRLLELLDDPELMVRSAARSALERMSRQSLGDSRAAWAAWYETEIQWRETRMPEMALMLASADDLRMRLALDEVARHGFFRHQLAAGIAPLCLHQNQQIAINACKAMIAIDSLVGATFLVQALDGHSPEVHKAAWAALKKVSGYVLPPTQSAWLEALDL